MIDVKLCRSCNDVKGVEYFSKNSHTKDGLQNKCKECNKLYLKEWSFNNPDKVKHSYRNTNLENKLEYNRKYHQENKEYLKLYCKQWVRDNREQKNNHTRNRRDRQDSLSVEDVEYIRSVFNNSCFNCGSKVKLSLDHTMPFILGFKLSLNNCTLLCTSCNSSKKDKHPTLFYTEAQIQELINKYEQKIF